MSNNHPNRSMPRWTCDGFRTVRAETAAEAAAIFASRMAVRDYGRKGYMRTLTMGGGSCTFEAFIGYTVAQNTTSGHNVWICVHRTDPENQPE